MNTREEVERVLSRIRPRLQMDGGDVELVEITGDGVARVKLVGACQGCPMSEMTLKMAIETEIRCALPQISRVESI